MSYTYEQIMNYDQYQEICKYFFNLAKDQKTRQTLEDILYTGTIGDYTIKSEISCRNNPSIERQRRISMANLLVDNKETFAYLVQNNICLFHGTNANALPNIIKYGLNSGSVLQEKGLEINTGEYNYMMESRGFISFTDILDLARDYASLPAKNGNEGLSFGVVLGTDSTAIKNARTCAVSSELSEIGVVDNFPLGSIKCILVPKDKEKIVKKMFKVWNIPVLGVSDVEKSFYYVDSSTGIIEIYKDIYENLKKESPKSQHKFSMLELEELVKSRSAKDMGKFLSGIKKLFSNDSEIKSEVEHGRKR